MAAYAIADDEHKVPKPKSGAILLRDQRRRWLALA
jgi:hypothetical protein